MLTLFLQAIFGRLTPARWMAALSLGNVGLSGGYGESSSKSKQKSIPYAPFAIPFFRDEVLPYVQKQFGDFAGKDGSPSPLRTAAEGQTLANLRGDNLDNPYLKEQSAAIERQGSEAFNRLVGSLTGNAAQNGTLFSTKTNQIVADAARRTAGDISDRQTNLLADAYGRERGIQANSAGQAFNVARGDESLSLDRMLALLNIFMRGGKTSGRQSGSNWNVNGEVSASYTPTG